MAQEIRFSRQRAVACRGLFIAVAASLGCIPSPALHAQSPTVRGYITAVRPPAGFEVNGEHVITTADTAYGPIGAMVPAKNGPMREAVEIGAWVEVFGEHDRKTKTVTAQTVLFRDDRDRKLTGLGVIDNVTSTAPELVLAADGYRIRVTAATEVRYPKDAKSPADVYPGMWVLYEGNLDKDGLLVAGKVRFLSTKHASGKSEKTPGNSSSPAATPQPPATTKDTAPPSDSVPGQTANQAEVLGTEVQVDDVTYKISKDQALQSRVCRVGVRLVPAFQKKLLADDPTKMRFLFVAVDDPAHEVHISSDVNGFILVPAKLAARFRNDDQLAAVLADGIALRLQQEAPTVIQVNRITMTEAAGMAAASLVPYAGLVAGSVYQHGYEKALKEQRWRVALQLMANAGYDPWQAPEAWRLAAPDKLPADTSTLKYPDRSNYQFSILSMVYKKSAPNNATESGSTANSSATGKP